MTSYSNHYEATSNILPAENGRRRNYPSLRQVQRSAATAREGLIGIGEVLHCSSASTPDVGCVRGAQQGINRQHRSVVPVVAGYKAARDGFDDNFDGDFTGQLPCHEPRSQYLGAILRLCFLCIVLGWFIGLTPLLGATSIIASPLFEKHAAVASEDMKALAQTRILEADTNEPWLRAGGGAPSPAREPVSEHATAPTHAQALETLSLEDMMQEERKLEAVLYAQEEEREENAKSNPQSESEALSYQSEIFRLEALLEELEMEAVVGANYLGEESSEF